MDPNLPNNPNVPPSAALPNEAPAKLGEISRNEAQPRMPSPVQPLSPDEALTKADQPPVPPLTPSIPTTPVEPPKPKTNLVMIISLIILVCSLLALGWYFLSQKVLNQTPITSYEECINTKGSLLQETYPTICVTKSGQRFTEPITSPLPTPDITSGWKTFIGKNYQLKYPNNLTSEERVKGYFAFLIDPKNKADVLFTIDERNSNKNLETYKTEQKDNLVSPTVSNLPNSLEGFATEGTVGPGFGQGLYVKSAYVNINGKIVIISCDVNKTCQETLLNQILSTFKVLEATPSASPISTPSSSLQ